MAQTNKPTAAQIHAFLKEQEAKETDRILNSYEAFILDFSRVNNTVVVYDSDRAAVLGINATSGSRLTFKDDCIRTIWFSDNAVRYLNNSGVMEFRNALAAPTLGVDKMSSGYVQIFNPTRFIELLKLVIAEIFEYWIGQPERVIHSRSHLSNQGCRIISYKPNTYHNDSCKGKKIAFEEAYVLYESKYNPTNYSIARTQKDCLENAQPCCYGCTGDDIILWTCCFPCWLLLCPCNVYNGKCGYHTIRCEVWTVKVTKKQSTSTNKQDKPSSVSNPPAQGIDDSTASTVLAHPNPNDSTVSRYTPPVIASISASENERTSIVNPMSMEKHCGVDLSDSLS